mmetsp:Transcript_69201/g.149254  ORF Transcript_69201/g.149254 Transcript_69201/m.149254 type:complete len:91 (+) Transcript_69201:614-886(+)
MLCDFKDLGMTKCEKYWDELSTLEFSNQLSVQHLKTVEIKDNLFERTFKLVYNKQIQEVTQIHITQWDDSLAITNEEYTDYLVDTMLEYN